MHKYCSVTDKRNETKIHNTFFVLSHDFTNKTPHKAFEFATNK